MSRTYHENLLALTATTRHGERVVVVGPAGDPARACVQLTNTAQTFTPCIEHLTFDRVGIARANRLATTDQRAHAWNTLMAGTAPTDDENLMHAADVLCDAVTFTLNNDVS